MKDSGRQVFTSHMVVGRDGRELRGDTRNAPAVPRERTTAVFDKM